MASKKQISANRANAKKSTGPRSEKGKEASRRNALKHGLTARDIVIFDEDPADFEALKVDLFEDYQPVGRDEIELVSLIAGLFWRLRRVSRWEAALLSWQHYKSAQHANGLGAITIGSDAHAKAAAEAELKAHWPQGSVAQRGLAKLIGQTLEASLANIMRINAYENDLVRKLSKALDNLTAIQAERRATIDHEPIDAVGDEVIEDAEADAESEASSGSN